ncbi:N-acetylmuramoyl-L-alanine amidase [Plantactinospora sp. B24E8]|uniref:golvesin C-terminal-like domain-containing protein n=1 Tax=Plantactinospora sp. B24E8 TaxID=3153567 RepID=UPI00325F0423
MTGNPLSRRDVVRGAVLLGVGAATGGLSLAGTSPALAAPDTGALLAVEPPTIASCATWGARTPGSLSVISSNPDKILIHHTAGPNSTTYTQAHAYSVARSIQNFHMNDNGWSDSGQHFTISRGGYVMEGRHNSLTRLRAGSGMVVGAHCPGQNDKAIGIENEGTYTSATPPAALYDRLVQFCAYICDQYGIAASRIYGHRDYVATACPGNVLYGMLPQLRADVADALSGGGTPPPAFSTIVDNTTAGRFTASANWLTSSYSAERYGADYRYANPEPISDVAWYKANIPAEGTYRVDAWYPGIAGYNTATPYIVVTKSGNQTVVVDQSTGGGAWRSLGTFTLTAGDRNVAGVSRWSGASGYVVADAIRITRV